VGPRVRARGPSGARRPDFNQGLRRPDFKGINVNRRIALGVALSISVPVVPLVARAQSGTENYFFPPTIKTFGKSSVPFAGPGKVVVKVLVKADGSFEVQKDVVRSTNHGDDAAALDIARHSTYHPAGRGPQKTPATAFYDFTVNFTGSGASGDTEASSGEAGTLAPYETEIKSAKYSDAIAGLTTYLQAHPNDPKATLDLGVAQALSSDYGAAAASFNNLNTVPDNYKALVAKSYAEASMAASKEKKNDLALADAKKAASLAPGPFTDNALGTAESAAGDNAAALADLEKARGEASALKASDRVAIDLNLLNAQLDAGKDDDAKATAAEIKSLDPSNASLANVLANHYVKLALAADAAEKFDAGQADWEQAASAAPSQAASFYARAGIDELNKKTGSDLSKAKAEADKGLAADPNSALANYVEGVALAKAGKKADALTYLNKADAEAKAANDTMLTTSVENVLKQLNGS
jgi:hypothetical protein